MIEVVVFVCLVLPMTQHEYEHNEIVRKRFWSVLMVSSHREAVYEIADFLAAERGYMRDWKENTVDVGSIVLMVGLLYSSFFDHYMEKYPTLLATLVLCRWLQLAHSF